jgi:hypothetical protein
VGLAALVRGQHRVLPGLVTEYWVFPRHAMMRWLCWFWVLGLVFGLAIGYLVWEVR